MAPAWLEKTTLAARQAQFEEFVGQHRGILFKVGNAYARQAEDRQDLVQDMLAQAWRAFPSYDNTRKFSTWLYRIALNVAISARRGLMVRARHRAPADPGRLAAVPAPPAQESDPRVRELYRVIDTLDAFHRALLVLYLEGYDQREMADILGMTETNVATRLSRLRQRLRRDVGGESRESGGSRGAR